MAFGEPDMHDWPLVHGTPSGLWLNGTPLRPESLDWLDAQPRFVVTTSPAMDALCVFAQIHRPWIGRRWKFWRSLSYNPFIVTLSSALARIYRDAPPSVSLHDAITLVQHDSHSGTVRTIQHESMASIIECAQYVRRDAAAVMTPVIAARLFRASTTVDALWRTITRIDPLASLDALAHGDVASAHVASIGSGQWRVTISGVCKLRPGPVHVRWSPSALGQGRIGELEASGRGLHATLSIPRSRSRTIRPGNDYEATQRGLAQAQRDESTVYLSDNAFATSVNLDAIERWSGPATAQLEPLRPIVAP